MRSVAFWALSFAVGQHVDQLPKPRATLLGLIFVRSREFSIGGGGGGPLCDAPIVST
jgi:hypothetical protein